MADDTPEVTWEDQQMINQVNRLNNKLIELNEDLKVKKHELENMEEAENELILVDDPLIKFHVGEVFLNVAPEKNEEMLKALQERTRKTLEEIEENISSSKSVLAELKVKLYSKFKDQINLDMDED